MRFVVNLSRLARSVWRFRSILAGLATLASIRSRSRLPSMDPMRAIMDHFPEPFAILSAGPDPHHVLWSADASAEDGTVVRVNAALLRVLDRDTDLVDGFHFREFVPVDEITTHTRLLSELRRGARRSYQLESALVRPDGESVDVTISATVVRDGDGSPVWYVMTIHDETDRAAERRLMKVQVERLEAQVDALNRILNRKGVDRGTS